MFSHANGNITNSRTQKYICPKCNEVLKAVTVGNVIYEKSSNPFGNVKAYRTEFQCPICRLRFTLEDLRKIEQSFKKRL